jgi:hypothetical protein
MSFPLEIRSSPDPREAGGCLPRQGLRSSERGGKGRERTGRTPYLPDCLPGSPAYPRVLDELLPAACHVMQRYANNPIESNHGRLKARARPMRGLKRLRSARVISTGHAFTHNLRRGHYELGVDNRPKTTAPGSVHRTRPHHLITAHADLPHPHRVNATAPGGRNGTGTPHSCARTISGPQFGRVGH